MKILFDKIGYSKRDFNLNFKNISFNGNLIKESRDRVKLNSNLNGNIELTCDRCGDEFIEYINSPLNLTLTDRVIETEDDLDIIEFLDGVINLNFIIESEISSRENTYHICNICKNDKNEFEKEF